MKFLKEIISLICILIFVIGSNFFIENKTRKIVDNIDINMNVIIKKFLEEDSYDKKEIEDMVEKFEEDWNDAEAKLSYFAEHNELEKVTTDVVILKTKIKMDEKEDAYEKMEEIKFKIEHIKNKQKFKLNNVF